MVNMEHFEQLLRGGAAWNHWRAANPEITPDLSGAQLREKSLGKANLREADLTRADLTRADLTQADLSKANLREADLTEAHLGDAVLQGANLYMAELYSTDLTGANLTEACLFDAKLPRANLAYAILTAANLAWANLAAANLTEANLTGADLHGAKLERVLLVQTKLEEANLIGCRVYGISAWNVNLIGTQQSDLVITPVDEPVITVDNLEVAQFIYLLLNNQKIRDVIDTITSKAVLILGRFTPERKVMLDAMREELRRRNYLPILFDFEAPGSRDFTETISILAHMARFIIADLTEPSSLPKELEAIVPTLAVPVQPVLEGTTRPYSMFQDYWKYPWVLKVHRYEDLEGLIASLGDGVITPAEAKVEELLKQRPV